jgi:2-polyprenyl-3-methyl-5-hydroxy-6-metoxy-1,4-benzoquinol methylase
VIADQATEWFLSALRRSALQLCATGATVGALGLGLLCGLADQGWLTEYAWAETDAESAELARLEERIAAARTGPGTPAPEWLAVLASYRPLGGLPDADALLGASWPSALARCLSRQVAEPAQEAALQPSLPRLTAIHDATSARVRAQYEANPYPRWTGGALDPPSGSVHAVLCGAVPGLALDGEGPPAPEILIAGCGTGQHPIESARRFANSRVLAIDLSLRSLAYAARKTREIGIATIRYAQADIVELGGLDHDFDVIEAMGVLHHLEDPEQGWRALAGLLRPGGFMKLGLYSASARAPIARARAQIAAHGFARSPAEIRRFRRDMPGLLDPDAVATLRASPDFYSVSGCRDLLFHECEHHFTLARVAAALSDLDLAFLGFELPPSVGPQGDARRELAAWDAFEREHPDTFRAMYQFWVRRPA